jgi:hypothetical protein
VWSVLSVFFLLRNLATLWSLKMCLSKNYRVFMNKPHPVRSYFRHMPLRVITLDGFLWSPLFLTCCLRKASTPSAVLGTDVAVTTTFFLGFAGLTATWADFTMAQFMAMVNYRLGLQSVDLLKRRFAVISAMEIASYQMLTGVPMLYMLFLDRAQGPVVNGENVILIVRNMGVVAYLLGTVTVTAALMTRQLQSVLKSIANIDEQRLNGAGHILDVLKNQQTALFRQGMTACLVFALFSAPFAWPYQQYALSFLNSINAFVASPGIALLRGNWGKKSKSPEMTSNSSKQVSNHHHHHEDGKMALTSIMPPTPKRSTAGEGFEDKTKLGRQNAEQSTGAWATNGGGVGSMQAVSLLESTADV